MRGDVCNVCCNTKLERADFFITYKRELLRDVTERGRVRERGGGRKGGGSDITSRVQNNDIMKLSHVYSTTACGT